MWAGRDSSTAGDGLVVGALLIGLATCAVVAAPVWVLWRIVVYFDLGFGAVAGIMLGLCMAAGQVAHLLSKRGERKAPSTPEKA